MCNYGHRRPHLFTRRMSRADRTSGLKNVSVKILDNIGHDLVQNVDQNSEITKTDYFSLCIIFLINRFVQ